MPFQPSIVTATQCIAGRLALIAENTERLVMSEPQTACVLQFTMDRSPLTGYDARRNKKDSKLEKNVLRVVGSSIQ